MMILTLLLVLVLAAGSGNVEGRTITVDDSGGADYTSIQDAVENATGGDTVQVYPGIYQGPVTIDSAIELAGSGSADTIIDGADAKEDVVTITVNGVTVKGFTVRGVGSRKAGICVESGSNTLTNNSLPDSGRYGIRIDSDYGYNTISWNTITNKSNGIYLTSSNYNVVHNNTCTNNSHGLQVSMVGHVTLNNNSFSNNSLYAIDLSYCTYAKLRNNTMVGSGLSFYGLSPEDWNAHDIDSSNTVNGKPVHYFNNTDNGTVPAGAGQVILASCQWMVVEDQDCSSASEGIIIGFSSNITVSRNTCSRAFNGIAIYFSMHITVSDNTCSNNTKSGILVLYSDFNTISGNTCTDNGNEGIFLKLFSDWNSLHDNQIAGNGIGIMLYGVAQNNTATNNRIAGNSEGINATDNWDISIDAKGNYWGDDSGPYHPALNPSGKGDAVTNFVEFSPWKDEAGTLHYLDESGADDDNGGGFLPGFSLPVLVVVMVAGVAMRAMFGWRRD